MSQCEESFFLSTFLSQCLSSSLCKCHFLFLSVDSIITTIKRLLKIFVIKARLMLLCCQCWHEHSTITLDGCSVAEVDPKMKGTFCTFKRIWLFIGFSLKDNSQFNSWVLFCLFLSLPFPKTFLGFNLEWKKNSSFTSFFSFVVSYCFIIKFLRNTFIVNKHSFMIPA